jgi:hypothetical protein
MFSFGENRGWESTVKNLFENYTLGGILVPNHPAGILFLLYWILPAI